MIRFNKGAERKLRDDLARVGKGARGYGIYACAMGSANHRRIGTLDADRTAVTFDGTDWFAPVLGRQHVEHAAVVGDEALVPVPMEMLQSVIGRLGEAKRGKARSRVLSALRRLLRMDAKANPPRDPDRVIAEQAREIAHLEKVINANNGLYADQIARGLMIPSVDDYPFDPKSLVRLHKGFDGVAVEMRGSFLQISFVEGNSADELGFASMTKRQRRMRLAISRGRVRVGLCHLIMHQDGNHEWEVTKSPVGTSRPRRRSSG